VFGLIYPSVTPSRFGGGRVHGCLVSYIGSSSMCSAEGKEGGWVFGLNSSVTLVVPVCAVLKGKSEGGCLANWFGGSSMCSADGGGCLVYTPQLHPTVPKLLRRCYGCLKKVFLLLISKLH
jgi:hypothetical protein